MNPRKHFGPVGYSADEFPFSGNAFSLTFCIIRSENAPNGLCAIKCGGFVENPLNFKTLNLIGCLPNTTPPLN